MSPDSDNIVTVSVEGPPLISVDVTADETEAAVLSPILPLISVTNVGPPGPVGPAGGAVLPIQYGHTYAPSGIVNYDDRFPGFTVPVAPDTAVRIARMAYRIRSGGSLTFRIDRNGNPVPSLTGLVATTTPQVAAVNVPLTDLDFIELVPSEAAGGPTDFSATIMLETAPK